MTIAPLDVIPFPQRAASISPVETPPSILVVTCDPDEAGKLEADVLATGYTCRVVTHHEAAAQALSDHTCDACLIGSLPIGETAGALVGLIQQKGLGTQVICVIASASSGHPQLLPAANGIDLLHQPYTVEYFGLAITTAVQKSRLQSENRRLKRQLNNRNLREMVGHSTAMHVLRQQVQMAAEQQVSILLHGEPGSGIDLVAQAIHDSSSRAHRPFVKLDCSVLSAETLEQELFGEIQAGPFGQQQHQPGRLELADGGTLLLEQIQFMALPVQKVLVSLIRDQRFERVQAGERVRFDVRFSCGTHVDLVSLVEKGLFRRDLYEAISQCRLELPTLRSRKDDIAPLTESFLRRVSGREGKPPRSLTVDALHLLQKYDWPGNVRELENVIERACALDWGTKLTGSMIQAWLTPREITEEEAEGIPGLTLAEMERKLIETTFNRFAGNREKTARALQIGIRTLSGKLREYGYPPRGGPGSNLKAWTPTLFVPAVMVAEAEQRAA
ncbi:MAG: sigma-54 dependent transcriptional regulator [Planctomycetales bacterium]|jgi:DNA-binding NtrC family response regulator|nr:sigma-54 dependent transcriptional regulator [Planctomycetales bacterium]